ncbi:hypothetical protein V6Z11_D04G196500 [Gossypium hirsutum]
MGMLALACRVDSAVPPPGYSAFISGKNSLATTVPFSSFTNTSAAAVDSTNSNLTHWSSAHSSTLYRIDSWGAPYFAVNDSGNITVSPHGSSTLSRQEINLLKVVMKVSDPKSVGELGLQMPLIVRFLDVLKNRLESLQSAFVSAIQTQGYESCYQGVYPVKCNQDRFVVEDIVKFETHFRFGLEAGSKPELLLAMSCLCKGNLEALLICNGFKDAEYISLALLARKFQFNTVIVLEQEEEMKLVIDISKKLSVRLVIGLRAKLRTKHSGHFGSTSGEKGKFGLTTNHILRVIKDLHDSDMLDYGVSEAAQIYSKLTQLGADIKVIDIGGGLGIDYNGSKSGNSYLSVSYGLEEYASAVMNMIRVICDRKSVKHPIICSESGRAIVSHHSVLIFEAMSTTDMAPSTNQINLPFIELDAVMRHDNETCLFYADQLKQRSVEQFKEGSLGIEQLAIVDGLFDLVTKIIDGTELVRTYLINLSIFTSIPDFRVLVKIFLSSLRSPFFSNIKMVSTVPIHCLDQKPEVKAILSDLTYDSDGKIDKFIGGEANPPLHKPGNGQYYLGMFLGGVNQEALGGVHNLFGSPSVVTVLQSDDPHSFVITHAMPGPSCVDVIRVMQHEPKLMFENLKHRVVEFYGIDVGSCLASTVARSFHNMPYLEPRSSCSLIAMNNSGFYYCNEEDYYAGSETGANKDEHWSYCFA